MKKIFTLIIVALVLVGISPLATFATTTMQINPTTSADPSSPLRRPCIAIDSDLGYGSKDKTTNGSVVNMQVFLKLYGYLMVEPTGYFGPLTREAVKMFQRAYGLPSTGFFGPLSRGVMKNITCADDMPVPQQGVTVSVTTNKDTYKDTDSITITVKAQNTTNESKTFQLNGGCQTDYTVAGYTYLAARACIQSLEMVVIPAHGTKTWTMKHDPMEFKIPAGTHSLTAKVMGIGEATTVITVEDENSISVTNPKGGETWKGGTEKNITWKSPDVTYIQAPRFDISLVSTIPPCPPNVACVALPIPGPFPIVKNVIGSAGTNSYKWEVGITTINRNERIIPDGKYQIKICNAGSTTCSLSKAFTIIDANDGPQLPGSPAISITEMTPMKGPSGTMVTIYGYGFTTENNLIKFGDGYAANVKSVAVMDEVSSNGMSRTLRSITFTAPTFSKPACSFSPTKPCVTIQGGPSLPAGNYAVIINNENGSSGPMVFKLTR